MLGSHIDTVRDAGRYDGPLGVLLAIEAADAARRELPFALEVVAFADEEGGALPAHVPRQPRLGGRSHGR